MHSPKRIPATAKVRPARGKCAFTVVSLMKRLAPISLLLLPRARRASTTCSRAARGSFRRPSVSFATSGDGKISPECTLRMHSNNSSSGASLIRSVRSDWMLLPSLDAGKTAALSGKESGAIQVAHPVRQPDHRGLPYRHIWTATAAVGQLEILI